MIVLEDLSGENDSAMMDEDDMMMEEHTGEVLAGSTTPFLDFTKEDYDTAVAEGKTILLYFYADWCPVCKAELVDTYAAFNELNDSTIVGFRVHYRDSSVDPYEEALAKEYGITYQHTKVIIKDGEQVVKAPNSWNKEKYLEELKSVM